MLKQLVRLSYEADGRFATADELQFIKDYIASVDERISAYSKIRDAEDVISTEVSHQLQAQNPYIFQKHKQDYAATCQRDRKHVLRYAAASMLFADIDSLRDGFLIWYRTIIKAFKDEKASQATYKILPQVVSQFLTPSQSELIQPALELNKSILGE